YPLPIAQLDRFLFRIPMSYVDRETEINILEEHDTITSASVSLDPVCTRSEVLAARAVAAKVHLKPELRAAIVDIVQLTRGNALLQFGASTRAAIMLQSATRAWALVNGRAYATEDDLKAVLPYVLLHRIKFHGGVADPRAALDELVTPAMERLVTSGL